MLHVCRSFAEPIKYLALSGLRRLSKALTYTCPIRAIKIRIAICGDQVKCFDPSMTPDSHGSVLTAASYLLSIWTPIYGVYFILVAW